MKQRIVDILAVSAMGKHFSIIPISMYPRYKTYFLEAFSLDDKEIVHLPLQELNFAENNTKAFTGDLKPEKQVTPSIFETEVANTGKTEPVTVQDGKRKRRTKAEMEAIRSGQVAVQQDPVQQTFKPGHTAAAKPAVAKPQAPIVGASADPVTWQIADYISNQAGRAATLDEVVRVCLEKGVNVMQCQKDYQSWCAKYNIGPAVDEDEEVDFEEWAIEE